MSFFRGPKIVTDDLILYLDAGNIKSFRGEPTVNLFSTFSSNENNATLMGVSPIGLTCGANANWDRCNYGGGTFEFNHIETLNPYGANSLVGNLIVTVDGGDYRAGILDIGATTLNRTFTLSMWIKNNGGTDTVCSLVMKTNGDANGPAVAQTITNEWQRIIVTHTFIGTCNSQITSYLWGLNPGTNILLYGAQLEEKPYATDFINGTRGSEWYDLSKNNNDATMWGSVPFEFDVVNCFNFSGATGASAPSSSLGFTFQSNMIQRNGGFTFSCWIKNPNSGNSQMGLFSNASGGDGYRFGPTTTSVYFLCGPNYTEGNLSHGFTLSSDKWYFITAVYDRDNDMVYAYVNGAPTSSASLPSNQTQMINTTPGLVKSSCCTIYTGKLSTFTAHNRALTASEVLQNYNALKSRFKH